MKSFNTILCFLIITACSDNATEDENCKFLLDIDVNLNINLNLPQYSELEFAGNSVYVPNVGNKGIIIASTGVDIYAWDAADPNVLQTDCSVLAPSGLEGTSGCDNENTYSLVTGQALNNADLRCSLRFYPVERNGNTLRITY